MTTCTQCGLQWNEPPTDCPKCRPSLHKTPAAIVAAETTVAPKTTVDQKLINRRNDTIILLRNLGETLGLILLILGALNIFVGIILLFITAASGIACLVIGTASIINGVIWKSIFGWASELLGSQGRSEDLQVQILEELRKKA